MFKSVLLATDFSDRAEIARDVTIHLVKGTKTRVTVVTVYHPSDYMMWHDLFPPTDEVERYEQKFLKELISRKLHDYAKKLEKAGIKVNYVMKTGLVTNGILKAAKETKADLIILGSHSQRSLGDVMLGGTAAGVQAKATCPVLIASSKAKPKKKPAKKKPAGKKKGKK
ncbi:universal stress protein [candidate division WOR-3 bacterium]|nr:universal stress protein [candidate division WOR-3 bacterium]